MWQYPNWAVSQECVRMGIPYACFPHGMLEPWSVFGQGWRKAIKKYAYWFMREKKVFDKACCVFFATDREQMLARATFRLGPLQLILTPYGVEISNARLGRPERAELTQPGDRKIALFLGRVHPKKNVGFLIETWAAAEVPAEWHLVIAGQAEAGYLVELRALVHEKRLEGQVHFVGHVNGRDKQYMYQRAQWFLLPSNQENFGISVLEAISNGCPVAISDQVYISDMFHEKSEVLPLDPMAWIDFFRYRMQDEARRGELIAMDQARIVEKFKMEPVTERWVSTISRAFSAVQLHD
jgi:glycosyltransferase involved in cell wall biosynthesis